MNKRKYDPKVEHDKLVYMVYDKLVYIVYDNLEKSEIILMPNFSSLKYATDLRSSKADIIVYKKEDVDQVEHSQVIQQDYKKRIEKIYEIEVEESINKDSIQKWSRFYNECSFFFLIVPERCSGEVDKLCSMNGIIANILIYNIDENGNIQNIVGL